MIVCNACKRTFGVGTGCCKDGKSHKSRRLEAEHCVLTEWQVDEFSRFKGLRNADNSSYVYIVLMTLTGDRNTVKVHNSHTLWHVLTEHAHRSMSSSPVSFDPYHVVWPLARGDR